MNGDMARDNIPELRQSYLQSILDCTRDALFVTEAAQASRAEGAEHRICFVNDAFSRLTGYSAADAFNQAPGILLGETPDSDARTDLVAAISRAEKSRLIAMSYRKDGSALPLEYFVNPLLENDECRYVIAILQPLDDATARSTLPRLDDTRLKSLANNLCDAILVHQDKQPLFVNTAYVDLFGYANADEALREISPLMNLPLGEAADGNPIQCEALRTDGLPIFLTLRKHPIDWDGRQATQLTIARDARQKGATSAYFRPNCPNTTVDTSDTTLLADFLDALPVILAHKSSDLRYTYVNKTYADWVDIPREQIVGTHVSSVRNETHYQLMKPRRDAVLSGKIVQYTTHCEFPGRGMCELFTTLIPRRNSDGTITGYFSMAQDITNEKEAERALTWREEQLRLVVDSVPALISYRDRNLCYRYVNKPYAEWYGVRREDMIGSYMTDFIALSAFRKMKPDIDRVLAGERFRQYYVANFLQNDAPAVVVDYVPHEDENNNVVGFFALGQNCMGASDQEGKFDQHLRALQEMIAEQK